MEFRAPDVDWLWPNASASADVEVAQIAVYEGVVSSGGRTATPFFVVAADSFRDGVRNVTR